MLTELLQLFELKDFLVSVLLSRAEVQGRALQHKPAQPPVVQVVALLVVQSANQLAVPAHQSLHFQRDEALRVGHVHKEETFTFKYCFCGHVSPPSKQTNRKRKKKPRQV